MRYLHDRCVVCESGAFKPKTTKLRSLASPKPKHFLFEARVKVFGLRSVSVFVLYSQRSQRTRHEHATRLCCLKIFLTTDTQEMIPHYLFATFTAFFLCCRFKAVTTNDSIACPLFLCVLLTAPTLGLHIARTVFRYEALCVHCVAGEWQRSQVIFSVRQQAICYRAELPTNGRSTRTLMVENIQE